MINNILILSLIGLFVLITLCNMNNKNSKEQFWDSHRTNYSTYQDPTTFVHNPNPYENLETTHYKQQYHNKMQPKCTEGVDGDLYCPPGDPGYYKSYPGYFDNSALLKSFSLGYDVTGIPYNDYKYGTRKGTHANSKKSGINVEHPKKRLYHKTWLDYTPQKNAHYIGYPFYFHGKQYH